MAAASKARLLIGGKGLALSAEDIFNVAARGYQVELDRAAADRLEKNSRGAAKVLSPGQVAGAGAGAGGARTNGVEGAQEWLPSEQARAALTVRLIELISSHAHIRPELATFFSHLLNSQVPLRLPVGPDEAGSDAAALDALAQAAQGRGPALPPAELENGQLEPPGLTAEELTAVKEGSSPSVGVAALAVFAGQALLATADAVAALACEALQAVVTAWDAEHHEHKAKGQGEVAADLRSLLAGSTWVNPRKDGADLPAVRSLPQVHGPLREALKAAAAGIRAELNPAEAAPSDPASPGSSDGARMVANHMPPALQLLLSLLAGSRDRILHMASQLRSLPVPEGGAPGDESGAALERDLEGALDQTDQSVEAVRNTVVSVSIQLAAARVAPAGEPQQLPGLVVARDALSSVEVTRMVLALEAVVALLLLRRREAILASKQGGGRPGAAPEGGKGQKGGKGKEGKKGKGGGGLQLGRGTSVLRAVLSEAVEGSGPHLLARVEAVAAALEPRGERLRGLLADLRAAIESNETRRAPKIPKGTRDFLPEQMAVREAAFAVVTGVFKRCGGVEIDTPVFELRETLMGKYGEDSKLIYDLADQGGEILSLRYDLTVPFARYLAMHPLGNIKRYHIAKVYRRDNPQMKRGRFREFYQCDFDIAGQYAPMVPDAEILKVLVQILDELAIGDYQVKVNHRGLLDGMLDLCGVPASKFRPICSAIDKLDKEPWEAVRAEMVVEKGLPDEVADRIGALVVKRGEPLALLAELQAPGGPFAGHAGSLAALGELALLFRYLGALGGLHRVSLDLSLARGLDYYTGMIFEAVFQGEAQVGSIAAGGRYDHLVGMFSGKAVPSVGMSLGIERVFTIMMEKIEAEQGHLRATQTEVLVASIGPDLLETRMQIAERLRAGGMKVEYVFAVAPNMQKQLEYANKMGIPWMVLFGSDELAKGALKVKDLLHRTEEEVRQEDLLAAMHARLRPAGSQLAAPAPASASESKEAPPAHQPEGSASAGCWVCAGEEH